MNHWQLWFRVVGYTGMAVWLWVRRRRKARLSKLTAQRLKELWEGDLCQ